MAEATVDRLRRALGGHDRAVVAFSGGVDSSLLAYVATETLGADRVLCATAVSPSLATTERAACRDLAADWGLRWQEVRTDEMAQAAYRTNDGDRCFWCKDALMDALAPLAEAVDATVLLGVNVDDLGDHRPGQEAARAARRPVPPRRGRPVQERGPHRGPRPGPGRLGQARGALPGLTGALRHRGVGGRARAGRAGRGRPAGPRPR